MKCYLCTSKGVLICGNCPKLFCRECIADHYRECKLGIKKVPRVSADLYPPELPTEKKQEPPTMLLLKD